MCEVVLVAAVSDVQTDFYLNCQRYQIGDIICVCPDGWNWGVMDKAHPDWRILKFPGIDVSYFAPFVMPQMPVDPSNPSLTLLIRALGFNYPILHTAPSVAPNAITAGKINPYIADETRAVASLSVPLAAADVPALAIVKALVTDPNLIG